MTMTFTVVEKCELPSGARMVTGTVTCSEEYTTSGEILTGLSTYILSTDSPTVMLCGQDGYVLQWDAGTCAAGKVLAYEAGADAAALDEVAASTNLGAVVGQVIAIGAPA